MDWGVIASCATAIGVAFAAWEIRQGWKLSQTEFEDSLDQQYRSLSMVIPVDALIGKAIASEKRNIAREAIYNYLDLSNEQIFLRKRGRIQKDTWDDWCSGIESHLTKVAFKEVWDEVKKEAPSTFSFLEKLEIKGFKDDPINW